MIRVIITDWYPREGRRNRGRQSKRWEDELKLTAGPKWRRRKPLDSTVLWYLTVRTGPALTEYRYKVVVAFGVVFRPVSQIPTTHSLRYPTPSQMADNGLLNPLGLRTSMDGDDYLFFENDSKRASLTARCTGRTALDGAAGTGRPRRTRHENVRVRSRARQ
ncbi:hypothetical protein EVAR_42765_1 [Eumeta japonica]|uniref:Uncharacterized protein n=1 Tax=Eumeta variegata TaxID=151549 RepID=A0A4C1WN79_EUMVA|nr:hypothetical protein EVAR_42765_1 [Eumeta japonica]